MKCVFCGQEDSHTRNCQGNSIKNSGRNNPPVNTVVSNKIETTIEELDKSTNLELQYLSIDKWRFSIVRHTPNKPEIRLSGNRLFQSIDDARLVGKEYYNNINKRKR